MESWIRAAVGSLIALILAPYFNYSEDEMNNGLAGYNSVLTAIGLALFLEVSLVNWIVLIVPFFLYQLELQSEKFKTIWSTHVNFSICLYDLVNFSNGHAIFKNAYHNRYFAYKIKHPDISHSHVNFISGIITNFSEIFLVTSIIGSLLIIIGILLVQ